MSAATPVGAVTAYPINSWLVRRGFKHGMMSAAAPAMPSMAMTGAGGKSSRACARDGSALAHPGAHHQRGNLRGLLLALWVTAYFVPTDALRSRRSSFRARSQRTLAEP